MFDKIPNFPALWKPGRAERAKFWSASGFPLLSESCCFDVPWQGVHNGVDVLCPRGNQNICLIYNLWKLKKRMIIFLEIIGFFSEIIEISTICFFWFIGLIICYNNQAQPYDLLLNPQPGQPAKKRVSHLVTTKHGPHGNSHSHIYKRLCIPKPPSQMINQPLLMISQPS